MNNTFNFSNIQGLRIHMVGIKGTGMTALAEILASRGALLTGSDVPDHFYTDDILANLKIKVMTSFSEHNINSAVNLVIYSAAYKRSINPELLQADLQNIPVLLYTEALGLISATMDSSGIAGVHGKTTTTALSGTILKSLQIPATVLAGSAVSNFDGKSTMVAGSKYFIAETCEYQRHFLSFHPTRIILTSIESDHQDYYPEYIDIYKAFLEYINLLPSGGELIYCHDDDGAREAALEIAQTRKDIILVPYGETAQGDYAISNYEVEQGASHFKIKKWDKPIVLKVPGKHLALNAVASIALCESIVKNHQGTISLEDREKILFALASFRGSKRRSEIVGESKGILFMDDYAHHPTAIKTTLDGIQSFYKPKRLIVDFMAHTYSRTKALLKEFASSFNSADIIILHEIYASAREHNDGTINGKILYDMTKQNNSNALYYDNFDEALLWLKTNLKEGDLFITMGAGDNWKIGKTVFDYFNNKESM